MANALVNLGYPEDVTTLVQHLEDNNIVAPRVHVVIQSCQDGSNKDVLMPTATLKTTQQVHLLARAGLQTTRLCSVLTALLTMKQQISHWRCLQVLMKWLK
ncbi:hypothetical protein RND71_016701 [Anisodus tanguticus]|uniref:Uncharacterized protein n=1 Tax=Anisodus tanguticus TaxID=243964 RepID=A0AAE1S9R3_9SOLA|nr:hypothetical protein RND71_016701 [Anisodus tanguticus]